MMFYLVEMLLSKNKKNNSNKFCYDKNKEIHHM